MAVRLLASPDVISSILGVILGVIHPSCHPGMLGILVAFPMAYALFVWVWGGTTMNVLNFMALFIIMGACQELSHAPRSKYSAALSSRSCQLSLGWVL